MFETAVEPSTGTGTGVAVGEGVGEGNAVFETAVGLPTTSGVADGAFALRLSLLQFRVRLRAGRCCYGQYQQGVDDAAHWYSQADWSTIGVEASHPVLLGRCAGTSEASIHFRPTR